MTTARDIVVNEVANAQQVIAGLKARGEELERALALEKAAAQHARENWNRCENERVAAKADADRWKEIWKEIADISAVRERNAVIARETAEVACVREVKEWKAIADRAVERESDAHEQLKAAGAGSNSETLAARIIKLATNRDAWHQRASDEAAKAQRLQEVVDAAAKALGGGK